MVKKDTEKLTYESFMVRSFKWFLSWIRTLTVLFILMGGSSYYILNVNPYTLKTYTLSNGDKEVVFQSMMHLAKEDFYKEVKTEIKEYKNDNYTILIEWVTLKDKKNLEKFQNLMWFNFGSNTYKQLANWMWLKEQDTMDLIGWKENLDNVKVKNADVSIDDLVSVYEKTTGKQLETYEQKQPVKVDMKPLLDLTDKALTLFWKEALKTVRVAWLNLSRFDTLQSFISSKVMKDGAMETILEFRNDNIVKVIGSETNKKLYLNYGALHFKGVFERLQKEDSSWKIIKVEEKEVLSKMF